MEAGSKSGSIPPVEYRRQIPDPGRHLCGGCRPLGTLRRRPPRYEGREEIAAVTGVDIAMEQVEPHIDFDPPDGELSLGPMVSLGRRPCACSAPRDGMIIRHDCVLGTWS